LSQSVACRSSFLTVGWILISMLMLMADAEKEGIELEIAIETQKLNW
jgi:hypothetical protein